MILDLCEIHNQLPFPGLELGFIRGEFDKFPDFFVQAFIIVVDVKIYNVIAIHLMR